MTVWMKGGDGVDENSDLLNEIIYLHQIKSLYLFLDLSLYVFMHLASFQVSKFNNGSCV